MTWLELLTKGGVAAHLIVEKLNRLRELVPDLAPQIDDLIAELSAAVDPANLAGVVASLPGEALNIFKGHFDPRDKPSDLA